MPAMPYSEMARRRWLKHHRPMEDRLWEKITKRGPDECWLWNRPCKNRYPHLRWNGQLQAPHRIIYYLTNGEIPNGVEICHSCDTPKCCNFRHLFAATHSENMADMVRKGRQGPRNHPWKGKKWRRNNPWEGKSRDEMPMSKYSTEFILQLKKEHRRYTVTARDLAAKYGLSLSQTRNLIYAKL